ncbi:glycosyltransferase [Streptomyces sp. SJL17-1]|uniref:glycosyltransferase n=1 Tax=Streptomyces sp. SJL17-1 TaxID=2967223 RepID=UPI002965DB43|nr:glycosyltransferase [Streptomyces sp. SJL17-1]
MPRFEPTRGGPARWTHPNETPRGRLGGQGPPGGRSRTRAPAQGSGLGRACLLAGVHVLLFPPTALGGRADIPLTVLQALASGRPAILSDLPRFADLGHAVLRAPAGDARRTGQQPAWLLDQPRSWDVLAERGRALVEDHFGPERFAARYAALYRELLS